MANSQLFGAVLLAGSILAAAALAQSPPLTARDVLGDWALRITPTDRQDLSVSVETADGGPAEFPLTVATADRGRLRCVVSGRPANCRIENGRLVVDSPSRSGGARMIFTLTDRARAGFGGTVRFRVRLLPIGGQIGTVSMTRR